MSESRKSYSKGNRVKSATARLTPTESQKPKQNNEQSAKERVKSARLNREKNDSSKKVFPRPLTAEKKERYTSIYNKDFEGTYLPPTEPRPTSPTRRNNPHPTQQFMVWRVPSREIGAQVRLGSSLGPRRLSGSYSIPDDSEFDEFEAYNYDRFSVPLPQPSSKDYGAYLQQMRAAALVGGDRVPSRQSQRGEYYGGLGPSLQKPRVHQVGPDVLSRTLKDGNSKALTDWLQTASPSEQQAVLKMLKDAETAQVKQSINDVMQPGAAEAVKDWLKHANEHEHDVAVRLFSSLGSRKGHRQRSLSEPHIRPPSRNSLPPPPLNPSLVDQRLTSPTVEGKPWPKSLWHHLPVRDPPPRVYHRGALFGKGNTGASHFTIHPEWPDYQQSTFSSDVVR